MKKAPIAAMLACGFALSVVPAMGQDCTRETPCADKNHHTTAKIIGGSAAGGAVVGGVVGGAPGALVGGAVGAGGGLAADTIRKHHNRRKYGTANPRKSAYRHRRHHRVYSSPQ
jgi:uncharacterized protein YcfJ